MSRCSPNMPPRLRAHPVAKGEGWQVRDVVCTAGPRDRPFEEEHGSVCVAVVTAGSFRYRTTSGEALLVPGSMLLGNKGHCFECGHEHAAGDRCLSFHFSPECFEEIAAATPGAQRAEFRVPHLPPMLPLLPQLAASEAARDGDAAVLEELALDLGGAVLAATANAKRTERAPSRRDTLRVTVAARRIEAEAQRPLPLRQLARDVAMTPYHFLRTFRHVIGMTPHQFVLYTRLRRAMVRLRFSDAPVSAIALEEGFNDLSTFNRRFRRLTGMKPMRYRAWAGKTREI